jgi:glycosyltransferase involved in cell wall biosynthesis
MNELLISVIIPARDSEDTIKRAIDSIAAQTYKNLEIIVIDDNSTDGTKEIVEKLAQQDTRIHYYALPEDDPHRIDHALNRNINAGYAARNFGFTKATGKLITFQDADDASLLNRIEVQYGLLTKYNAIHICTTIAPFDEKRLGTTLDVANYSSQESPFMSPQELYKLSQATKGIVAKVSPALNALIPFRFKRLVSSINFSLVLLPLPWCGE